MFPGLSKPLLLSQKLILATHPALIQDELAGNVAMSFRSELQVAVSILERAGICRNRKTTFIYKLP